MSRLISGSFECNDSVFEDDSTGLLTFRSIVEDSDVPELMRTSLDGADRKDSTGRF